MSIEAWFLPSIFALIVWGVAAFTPKLVVASLPPVQVLVYQAIGLALFATCAVLLVGDLEFPLAASLYGVGAGALGMLGQYFYVTALTRGPVSFISILASLYPAVVIFLAFIFLKEDITFMQGVGIVLSIAALLMLVSQKSGHQNMQGTGWVLPSLGALCLWAGWAFLPKLAVLGAEPVTVLVCEAVGNCVIALILFTTQGVRLQKSMTALKFATLPGFISMGAALCYIHALKIGPVSLISVLTALYPVVTVLLARVILKEKMTPVQIAACFIALGAIGLMVV